MTSPTCRRVQGNGHEPLYASEKLALAVFKAAEALALCGVQLEASSREVRKVTLAAAGLPGTLIPRCRIAWRALAGRAAPECRWQAKQKYGWTRARELHTSP